MRDVLLPHHQRLADQFVIGGDAQYGRSLPAGDLERQCVHRVVTYRQKDVVPAVADDSAMHAVRLTDVGPQGIDV